MKRTDQPAPLDARRMKLMALSGQIRATLRDNREIATRNPTLFDDAAQPVTSLLDDRAPEQTNDGAVAG